jgi:Derlin-2/3
MEFLASIPRFTKYWGIAILAVSLSVTIGVVSPYFLVFAPYLVFRGEIWRLITAPFFLGKLDLQLIFQLFLPFSLIRSFEQNMYPNRLSALVFIFILNAIFVFILSGLFGSLSVGSSMLTALTWVCVKHAGNQVVQFFMIIPLPIKWLPIADLLLGYLQGQSFVPGVIGIIAGHTVFFLLYILPVELGRPLLQTPPILSRLLDVEAPAGPGAERGGGFRGGGRRLG